MAGGLGGGGAVGGPTICREGDAVEVALSGRLRMSDYSDAPRQILEAMREGGARHLLLDLRDAIFATRSSAFP